MMLGSLVSESFSLAISFLHLAMLVANFKQNDNNNNNDRLDVLISFACLSIEGEPEKNI